MAKQVTRSFQSIGNGVYRVSGSVRRSAVTGRYVTENKGSSAVRIVSTSSKSASAKNHIHG